MRLAILAPTASAAFREEVASGQGGAERQLVALGRALAARGHQVDVAVAADDAPLVAQSGCRLWPIYPRGGWPLLKLAHPKGSALHAFLRERGSELLLQRGAAELTGLGCLVARLLGIGFVFAVASDSDLAAGAELLPHPQDRALFRLGLQGADQVIVQTQAQRRSLWRACGRDSQVLRSFPDAAPPERTVAPVGDAILWGGNLRPVKRPEWLLALAAALPGERFIVFGGAAPGHERYAGHLQARLRERPNIQYLGALPPAALPAVYRRCRIFLNTSEVEGFPNTLLEAWRHGLDVIASVDPDRLLSGAGLGLIATDLAGLRAALQASLRADAAELAQRRLRALDYLRRSHSPSRLAEEWERMLLACIGLRVSTGGPRPRSDLPLTALQ